MKPNELQEHENSFGRNYKDGYGRTGDSPYEAHDLKRPNSNYNSESQSYHGEGYSFGPLNNSHMQNISFQSSHNEQNPNMRILPVPKP